MSPPSVEKLAFVFAGGGSLGAVNVGMLKALLAHGIKADMAIGTSVGAINAVYFASNPTVDGLEKLEQIWVALNRDDVFPITFLSGLRRILSAKNHLVDPSSLKALLERQLNDLHLENCKIPCQVIATDILSGLESRLATGRAVDALLASTAIPAVFPPMQMSGRHFVDGGIANNTPISAAIDLGATHVIVLPTGFSCALTKPPDNLTSMALHALNLIISRQLIEDYQKFSSRVKLTFLPPLCPMNVAPHDFSHARELIERSFQVSSKWLDSAKTGHIPPSLGPHEHRGMM